MSSSEPSADLSVTARPLLVSAAEAALLLGVHRATLYDLMNGGALPSVKIGRRRLIAFASLEEFVKASERSGL